MTLGFTQRKRGRRMRAKAWIGVVGLLALVACGQPEPPVEVEKLADGGFRMTYAHPDLKTEVAAQKLLVPTAIELCAGKDIRFGRGEFDAKKTPPVLVQDLHCGPAPGAAAAAATAFTPTADDQRKVSALSEQFLEIRRKGDAAAAKAMFDPTSSYADMAAWSRDTAAFNGLSGPEIKRAITRVSWFENPASAPSPGVYAAVDYIREFQNVKTACGFVVWRRQADGGWRIDREQLRYLTAAQEAAIKRSDLPEARADLGCR